MQRRADYPNVTVLTGEWTALCAYGPFDLLVLDGGGTGKGNAGKAAPQQWLRPGGALVVDDFSPAMTWPPVHDGKPDTERMAWLADPELTAAEVQLAPDLVSVVGMYRPGRVSI